MATIFDSIVRRENDYTQLLRNVMERSPALASRVLTFLLDREFDELEVAKLRSHTQFRSENGREIPDLVLEGEQFRCLIEVKVDPNLELTEAQARGYRNCFSGLREEHLVFLVPNSWKHRTYVERLRADSNKPFVVPSVKTWTGLVEAIYKRGLGLNDPLIEEALEFLMTSFEVIGMKQEEKDALQDWNPKAYSAVRKLQQTVDQTRKLFAAQGSEVESETSDPTGYGFYVKEDGKYRVWVGIWDAAPFPLMFGFHTFERGWRVPAVIPEGSVPDTSKGTHRLWRVPQDEWESSSFVFERVRKFLVDTSAAV